MAPTLFQKNNGNNSIQNIPQVTCCLDDILITGASNHEYLQNLEQVLMQLQAQGMQLQKAKCSFLMTSTGIEYPGHRVDAQGAHHSEDKLCAVVPTGPTLKNVKELRSFLGLIHYYSNFIPNLSSVLHLLNSLLQKDAKWRWTQECTQAFKSANNSLTSASVLVHYDPAIPICVAADASSYELGAVLSYVMPDKAKLAIAFASRTLTSAERKYAKVEKEALTLILLSEISPIFIWS